MGIPRGLGILKQASTCCTNVRVLFWNHPSTRPRLFSSLWGKDLILVELFSRKWEHSSREALKRQIRVEEYRFRSGPIGGHWRLLGLKEGAQAP